LVFVLLYRFSAYTVHKDIQLNNTFLNCCSVIFLFFIGGGAYVWGPFVPSSVHCILMLLWLYCVASIHVLYVAMFLETNIQYYWLTTKPSRINWMETVSLPLQVHERGTVYRQPSAQPLNRSLLSEKNLSVFFLDYHFVCDNVNIDYVRRFRNSLYRI